MIRLTLKDPKETRTLEFANGDVSVGRARGNALVLQEPLASRHHCTFIRTPTGYVVADLNSYNGTRVNEEKVTEWLLRPGDVVRIGATTLHVEATDPAPPAESSGEIPAVATASRWGSLMAQVARSSLLTAAILGGLGTMVCYVLQQGWVRVGNLTPQRVWYGLLLGALLGLWLQIMFALFVLFIRNRNARKGLRQR